MIGKLGLCFGGAEPYAYGQSGPLANAGFDRGAHRRVAAVQVRYGLHAKKRFVDAVDLDVGRIVAKNGCGPIAHIAVKRVVRRQRDDVVLLGKRFHFEPRFPHFHAQRLHLVAASNRTTIVVRKHYNRFAVKLGIKHALTRNVEIIHIHECEYRCH